MPASTPPSLLKELSGRTYAADLTICGSLTEAEAISGVEFDGCRFERSVLAGPALLDCTFSECVFAECDLSRTDVTDSPFSECTFVECRLLGVNFALAHTGSLAPPFVFERCRLDYASFRGLDVTGSSFRDSRLNDVDFGETVARVDVAGAAGLLRPFGIDVVE